jgi:hypothetical protein
LSRALTPRLSLGRDDDDRPLARNLRTRRHAAVWRKAGELSRSEDFDLRDHKPPSVGRVELKRVRRRLKLSKMLPFGENTSFARAFARAPASDDDRRYEQEDGQITLRPTHSLYLHTRALTTRARLGGRVRLTSTPNGRSPRARAHVCVASVVQRTMAILSRTTIAIPQSA